MILDLILEQQQQDARRIVSITDDGTGVPLVTTAYPHCLSGAEEINIHGTSTGVYEGSFGDYSIPSSTTIRLETFSFGSNSYGGEITRDS